MFAVRPELPCLIYRILRDGHCHRLSITDHTLGIFRHCRLSEIRERTIPLIERSKKEKQFLFDFNETKPIFSRFSCTKCHQQKYCKFMNYLLVRNSNSKTKRRYNYILKYFVCVEALRLSQHNGVMSSAVSLPNHTFTGQA